MNEKMERERFLLRFTEAVLAGDLDAQDALTAQAEGNLELQEALWEIQVSHGDEVLAEQAAENTAISEQTETLVRDLLASHFQGRLLANREDASIFQEEPEPAPLTIGDVAVSLKAKLTQRGAVVISAREKEAALREIGRLEASTEPLPERLTPKGIRTALARLGTQIGQGVGRWFEEQFHIQATHLSVGRSSQARLAAARRAARTKAPKPAPPLERPQETEQEEE